MKIKMLTVRWWFIFSFYFIKKSNISIIIKGSVSKSESEVAQSCLTLCDPVDCSPPGCSVHGILQARTLEWVAISFSNLKENSFPLMNFAPS